MSYCNPNSLGLRPTRWVEGDASFAEMLLDLGPVLRGVDLSLLGIQFVTTNGTDYSTQTRGVEVSLVETLGGPQGGDAPSYGFPFFRKRIIRAGTLAAFSNTWEPGEMAVPASDSGYYRIYLRVDAGVGAWSFGFTRQYFRSDR